MVSSDAAHSRLRWRLRRGTKELDLVCEALLAEGLDSLTLDEFNALLEIVELSDPDILGLLQTNAPIPPQYAIGIARLRKAIQR